MVDAKRTMIWLTLAGTSVALGCKPRRSEDARVKEDIYESVGRTTFVAYVHPEHADKVILVACDTQRVSEPSKAECTPDKFPYKEMPLADYDKALTRVFNLEDQAATTRTLDAKKAKLGRYESAVLNARVESAPAETAAEGSDAQATPAGGEEFRKAVAQLQKEIAGLQPKVDRQTKAAAAKQKIVDGLQSVEPEYWLNPSIEYVNGLAGFRGVPWGGGEPPLADVPAENQTLIRMLHQKKWTVDLSPEPVAGYPAAFRYCRDQGGRMATDSEVSTIVKYSDEQALTRLSPGAGIFAWWGDMAAEYEVAAYDSWMSRVAESEVSFARLNQQEREDISVPFLRITTEGRQEIDDTVRAQYFVRGADERPRGFALCVVGDAATQTYTNRLDFGHAYSCFVTISVLNFTTHSTREPNSGSFYRVVGFGRTEAEARSICEKGVARHREREREGGSSRYDRSCTHVRNAAVLVEALKGATGAPSDAAATPSGAESPFPTAPASDGY